ncbi:MAG: S8 family peptidase [Taibaiella sp.]|nr:S8 family peptidase [Taibaiella sp.]
MCRRFSVIFLITAMLICGKLSAVQYAYIVRFTDKNNTPFSLSSPLSYLSSRSVDRRTAQSIAVDSTDLPVSSNYIDSVLTLTGGKIHGSSRWLNFCVVLLSDSVDIHLLDGKPYVSSTQFTAYYADSLHKPAPPHDGVKQLQKTTAGDAVYYGNTWKQTALVNGATLHDGGYTGNGKLIAVFDAGFIDAESHPGFAAMWAGGRMVDKYNFKLRTDFIYGYDTHGTKVLSTMAGYIPNTYVGSAPMASYALYVTEDGNSEQPIELINMLFAAERSDSIGADIIISALGYNTFDNPADNFDFTTDFDGKTTVGAQAANMATKKGMLFVATAGNEGGGGWNKILTPGDADSALTIGSVSETGVSAPSSGYGPNAAGTVKPDVCGMGQGAALFLGSSGYVNQSGTSYATPQIAGWAACLWQAYPAATPHYLRQAIIKCASMYTSPGAQKGYGIPDFSCSRSMLLNVSDAPQVFSPSRWVSAAPNPFADDLSLIVSPYDEQMVSFSITDMTGKIVLIRTAQFSRGYNSPFTISLAGLPAGVYILKATSATDQQVLKLVKQ